MPANIALICHLDRLGPEYDGKEKKEENRAFFSLNVATAYHDSAPDHATRDEVKTHLLPWLWGGPGEVEINAGYFKDDGTGGKIFVKLAPKLVEFPDIKYSPTKKVKPEVMRNMVEQHLHMLHAINPGLEFFLWKETQVGDAGAADDEAFRNVMGYYSTLPAPLPHASNLSLCFLIEPGEFAAFAKDSDGLLYATPKFKKQPDGAGNNMQPDDPSLKADVLKPLTPGELEAGKPAKWQYVSAGGGVPGTDTHAVHSFFQPWNHKEKVFGPGSLYSPTYWLAVPDPDNGALDGYDWAVGLVDKLGDGFDLAQRIVDTLRGRLADIGKLKAGSPKEFEDGVLVPLREAVVACTHDMANTGIHAGPDGQGVSNVETALCDIILQTCVPGDDDESKATRRAMRDALERYEANLKLAEWRALLRRVMPDLADTRALREVAPGASRYEPLGRGALKAELSELEQITAALAKEENLQRLFLAQWDEAARTAAAEQARLFWNRFEVKISTQILPPLSLRRRLSHGNIGAIWPEVLPTHTDQKTDRDQLLQKVSGALVQYFEKRCVTTPVTDPYTKYSPVLHHPLDALKKIISDELKAFAEALVKQDIFPQRKAGEDDDSPTETAHPLLVQVDRISGSTNIKEGEAQTKEDITDLARRFAGVCMFVKSNRDDARWRCLNMASIEARVRRLEKFTLPDNDENKALLAAINEALAATFADVAALEAYLNEELKPDGEIDKKLIKAATHREKDTEKLFTKFDALDADDKRRLKWWLLEDAYPHIFPRERLMHPCALVPSRLSYRDNMRQSFLAYDNHPLAAHSPAESLTLGCAPRDQSSGDVEESLIYQPVLESGDETTCIDWATLPALAFGRNYKILLATLGNSGALPAEIAARDEHGLLSHPAALSVYGEVNGKDEHGKPKSKLDGIAPREPQYMRRRRVGAPWRCTAGRAPLTSSSRVDNQDVAALQPVPDVALLAREFPTAALSAPQGDTVFYYDEALQRGLLDLSTISPSDSIVWTVALEQIHDTAKRAEKGITLSLEEYERTPGKAIELKATNTGTHYHLDLQMPGEDLHSFEVPLVQGKWPKYHGLKLTLARVEESFRLDAAYQWEDAGWQTVIAWKAKGVAASPPILPSSPLDKGLARVRATINKEAASDAVVFMPPTAQIGVRTITQRTPEQSIALLPHPRLKNAGTYEFFVAPPTVDLLTWDRWLCREQEADATIKGRRIALWDAYHVDAELPPSDYERQAKERALDDPAVEFLYAELVQIYPERQCVVKDKDGSAVDLFLKPLSRATGGALRKEQRAPIKVVVKRDVGEKSAFVHVDPGDGIDIPPTLAVTLPPGALFQLRIYAAVEARFCEDTVEKQRRFPFVAAKEKRKVTRTDGGQTKEFFLFSPQALVLESATETMPTSGQLWDALRFAVDDSHIRVKLQKDHKVPFTTGANYDAERFTWVQKVEVLRQMWRWQGRPLTDFPIASQTNPDAILDHRAQNTPFIWDAEGFGTRPQEDHVRSPKSITRGERAPLIFEQSLAQDSRGHYYRFAVQARSRYFGIRSLLKPDAEFPLSISRRPEDTTAGEALSDPWRRCFVPCRWHIANPVPKPKIKMIVPLTQSRESGGGGAGLLVVLREPWHEVGGLREFLDAEIVRVKAPNRPLELPEYGPDPIIRPSALVSAPDAPQVESPYGHTFDTDTEEPLFVASSCVVRPPGVQLKPKTLASPPRTLKREWNFTIDADAGTHEIIISGVETDTLHRWQMELITKIVPAKDGEQPKVEGQPEDLPAVALVANHRAADNEKGTLGVVPGGGRELLVRFNQLEPLRLQHPPDAYDLRLVLLPDRKSADAWTWKVRGYYRSESDIESWRELGSMEWENVTRKLDAALVLEGLATLPQAKGDEPTTLPLMHDPVVHADTAWNMARLRFRRRIEVGGVGNNAVEITNHVQGARVAFGGSRRFRLSLNATDVGHEITVQALQLKKGEKVDLTLLDSTSQDFHLAIAVRETAGNITLLFNETPVDTSIKAAELPLNVDVRLVLHRISTPLRGRSLWRVMAFYQLPQAQWQLAKNEWNSAVELAEADAELHTGGTDDALSAVSVVATPLARQRYSDYSDPYWVQLLPDTSRVCRRNGEALSFDTLSFFLAADDIHKKMPDDKAHCFRLRQKPNRAAKPQENNAVGVDTRPRYPAPASNGRNVFTRYLLLTQRISDVRGRRNQERYVGLYQMDEQGIAHPLRAVGTEVTGSETLLRDRKYQVRLVEVQQRLEQLPRFEKKVGEFLPNELIYYRDIDLNRAENSDKSAWEVTLPGIHAEQGSTPESLIFSLNKDSGEILTSLTVRFPAKDKVELSCKTDPDPKKDFVEFATTDPFDIRMVVRPQSGNAPCKATVQLRSYAATPNELHPDAPWRDVEALKIDGFSTKEPLSVKVSVKVRDGIPNKVNYLPPSLTAEPWDHLFPIEGPNEKEGEDVKSRLVTVSPPLNGLDTDLF